ncbi:MAG: hypothetical protein ACYCZV_09085 [Acidimicrobiales bacterium]
MLAHRMLNTVAVVVGAGWTLQENDERLPHTMRLQLVDMIVKHGEELSDQLHDLMTGLLCASPRSA